MADNNDEYHLEDLDSVGLESTEKDPVLATSFDPEKEAKVDAINNIKRNAVVIAVVLIFAMIVYKFLSAAFSTKKVEKTQLTVVEPVASPPPMPKMTMNNPDSPAVTQKLSALALNQQNTRSEMEAMSSRLNGLDNTVSNLASQLAQINQTLLSLSAKVEAQSEQFNQRMVKSKPTKLRQPRKKIVHYPQYYIQAIIPGRAWLTATNGTTLTVREGSAIPGYGLVKSIDANQGQVIMSSGRKIAFNQQDS